MGKLRQLQQLKKVLIESMPEIRESRGKYGHWYEDRPITLEDVLMAMKSKNLNSPSWSFEVYTYGKEVENCVEFNECHCRRERFWQLNKPLDQQSETTIKFLKEILCKNTDKDKEH